jgi:endonuclease/exonuclease/phosphatase family metal-dependent hydrolase
MVLIEDAGVPTGIRGRMATEREFSPGVDGQEPLLLFLNSMHFWNGRRLKDVIELHDRIFLKMRKHNGKIRRRGDIETSIGSLTEAIQPDIFGLCEITGQKQANKLAKYLEKAHGFTHFFHGAGTLLNGSKKHHNQGMIASKYAGVQIDTADFPIVKRQGAESGIVAVRLYAGPVLVQVHFSLDPLQRLLQMQYVTDLVKDESALVFGDFNCTYDELLPELHTLELVSPKTKTFSYTPGVPVAKQIDYVLASSGIRCLDWGLDTEYSRSDHAAVWVRWRPPN